MTLPAYLGFPETLLEVRDPAWYSKALVPLTKGGIMPVDRYLVRKQGEVELGGLSCATCHTRIMPDGSVLKGAQGNFPLDRISAYRFGMKLLREGLRAPQALCVLMSDFWLLLLGFGPIRSGNSMRRPYKLLLLVTMQFRRASWFVMAPALYPTQVPDLIGVKQRHYLDRTGLQQHRGIVDLMRYAALNQGGDSLSDFNGFIPGDFPNFQKLPEPAKLFIPSRYSDEQLYALTLYVCSLQPPANSNKFDEVARHGNAVFQRAACGTCHTPGLYTNNKLTPAAGLTINPDDSKKYSILPMSVGMDPNLTMNTRRGTDYYKVPSLRGVWYRGMFGHSGWCATLEDWFDPLRTRNDDVPTGFKPYGVQTYAVQGHPFGLDLSKDNRRALVAFLKTL